MNIKELLHEQSILIPLAAASKNEVMEKLVDALVASGAVHDREAYLGALHNREATGSTGIGFRVAIPHGKSSGVTKPALAFAKLAEPIDWDSLDGQPVTGVFMIAVPEAAAGNEHLQILIAISRKLIDDEFRERLLAVEDAATLNDLLGAI
ncbi:fructose-specific phosphotransferase system IIA component [Paenibacillus phyllosphaerae]|uniref:Fructose-specific phosphotransferase system IIA component n=1 Tax=Paenibacillus phyllosphaerae TaxID=274593 RepID=A0A7W5AT05_9BACL|nr:fructose PTS transporter subunit IIA [Paenibacillus phyllosphaerae]MBB3108183.1 fructose-specific phosphotransferase system IIA component [Paenibacillus phyllosphaerae]